MGWHIGASKGFFLFLTLPINTNRGVDLLTASRCKAISHRESPSPKPVIAWRNGKWTSRFSMRIRYIRTRPTGWSLRLQTSILLVCFIPTDGKNQHGLTRANQKNLPKSNSSTCPRQLPPKRRVRSPSTRISTATGLSVWTCLVRPAGHLCRRSRASALVFRVCWRRIRATNGRPETRILSCRIAAGQGTFISSMMMTMSDSIIVIRFWAFFLVVVWMGWICICWRYSSLVFFIFLPLRQFWPYSHHTR